MSVVTQYLTLGLSLSNPSPVEIIIFNVSFRIEIVVPVLMALSQIAWNNMTGTEDQLFEDCMKLPNEPKRVSLLTFSFMTYIQLFICHTVYGVNGCISWIRIPCFSPSLHHHGHLYQTDEGDFY